MGVCRASRGVGWEFLHVCVDDPARVSYTEILSDALAVTVTALTEWSVAWFGALGRPVERVMTDNRPTGGGEVASGTEVWIAESPGHLVHFDGARLLGPYEAEAR